MYFDAGYKLSNMIDSRKNNATALLTAVVCLMYSIPGMHMYMYGHYLTAL